ncbi:uncharacterized protein LOC131860390 [Cryptomeria japonica]|uniref:uncharacterized protein LOC131860390 n=1 Tax=Cryptomeria japonica TaxID=3369 RepID=UPI0027DA6AB6|nr:uncharacterized protein LOC131860390 [Cryptomeria japonica]
MLKIWPKNEPPLKKARGWRSGGGARRRWRTSSAPAVLRGGAVGGGGGGRAGVVVEPGGGGAAGWGDRLLAVAGAAGWGGRWLTRVRRGGQQGWTDRSGRRRTMTELSGPPLVLWATRGGRRRRWRVGGTGAAWLAVGGALDGRGRAGGGVRAAGDRRVAGCAGRRRGGYHQLRWPSGGRWAGRGRRWP